MRLHILIVMFAFMPGGAHGAALAYVQQNPASNIPGLAVNLETSLKNPWGMSFAANTPHWISGAAADVAILYSAEGAPVPPVAAILPASDTVPTGRDAGDGDAEIYAFRGSFPATTSRVYIGTISDGGGIPPINTVLPPTFDQSTLFFTVAIIRSPGLLPDAENLDSWSGSYEQAPEPSTLASAGMVTVGAFAFLVRRRWWHRPASPG